MTTIQRQYSLPNCRLILQGVSSDTDSSSRPLMSMVTGVECYLAGQKTPVTGGRALLESLSVTVSQYAQSYLSGIQMLLRRERREPSHLVQLEQVGENLHRLTIQPETIQPEIVQPEDDATDQAETATEIDLTTVQLFDLVEAVDQFFADAQTLPELGLKLDPLSKRHIKAVEPLAKRAVPAVIGTSGLAAAAALLFMLPAPQVKRPEAEASSTTEQTTSPDAANSSSAPSPPANPAAAPDATADGSTATVSPETVSPETVSPETGSPSTGAAATAAAGLNLSNAAEITDPDTLDRLTTQLYNKLDAEWQKKPSFDGELVYQVGVDPAGEIVGYKYSNDAALTYLNEVPLADVQFTTPTGETNQPESAPASDSASLLAQFRVVFKSDGVLEISPWAGDPAPAPSP
ncbi:MAG: DUF4335 domain-containing protein [Pegethrix bostrychoides GSE-TBD4-15B]|jgi:cytoskeletal protein RodZ|uniref:DUF4335 domain-containing protein n=1 Tax=Pegethrix bostrychoides GSE-TBD4-15B TaxID=2839662 RepID=A0A951P831_9CYAN|nr:DUF4335 domain-containing protein [Pegethrix bostrychoides GSE-TBD4-15B]